MELTIEIKPGPGRAQELDQALQALLPTIRKEKGCLDCRISRDVEDGEVFLLSGHWEAQGNLEQYIPIRRIPLILTMTRCITCGIGEMGRKAIGLDRTIQG